jgi:hypothetical protein
VNVICPLRLIFSTVFAPIAVGSHSNNKKLENRKRKRRGRIRLSATSARAVNQTRPELTHISKGALRGAKNPRNDRSKRDGRMTQQRRPRPTVRKEETAREAMGSSR